MDWLRKPILQACLVCGAYVLVPKGSSCDRCGLDELTSAAPRASLGG
jgi:hypothetical protein